MISVRLGHVNRSLNKIDKAGKRLKKDKKVLFVKWSVFGFKDIVQHFKDQSGPKGKWKPLAASTIAARRNKKKSSIKILQDTGSLRGSIRPGIGKTDFQRNRVILFTPIPYALQHDEGKRKESNSISGKNFGTAKIPARPFMWLSKDAMDKIKDQTIKFMRPWKK